MSIANSRKVTMPEITPDSERNYKKGQTTTVVVPDAPLLTRVQAAASFAEGIILPKAHVIHSALLVYEQHLTKARKAQEG